MGFIWALIVGGIIGAIAGAITNKGSSMGIIANIIAGLVGSAIGQASIKENRLFFCLYLVKTIKKHSTPSFY